jgi:hypothetical protein
MTTKEYCERCGDVLNPATMTMLELDSLTNRYHRPEEFPASGISQGGFCFGRACSKIVLANGGVNVRIRAAI